MVGKRLENKARKHNNFYGAWKTGLLGSCLQAAQSTAIREWSAQHTKGSVSDYLFRHGHNCYGWAQAAVMQIAIQPLKAWAECFIKAPHPTVKGNKNGDQVEPNTKCVMM